MPKYLRYIVIGVLGIALVCVRLFETTLFYDPYILFFKSDYLYLDNPEVNISKLLVFTAIRFSINTLLSVGIIYLIFKEKHLVKLSLYICGLLFLIVFIPFVYLVLNPEKEHYYILFNLRRFLIQPIALLILLPAFYYLKLKR